MSAVSRRIARRLGHLFALAAILTVVAASSAQAAPSLEVLNLRSDADEIQAVYVEATTGQFRLNFGTGGPGVSETTDISATATAPEVEAALNAVSNVATGGGSVSVRQVTATDPSGTQPYLVTFNGGPLGMKLQPLMTAKQGSVPLGASPLGGEPAMAYVATRLPGGLSHSDERVDYAMTIKNSAATASEAVAGDVLVCSGTETPGSVPPAPKNWTPNGFEPTQYDFEWRRNGTLIPGETTVNYIVTVADEGAALQCMVKGTNATAASKWASLPAQLVGPPSSPLPPIPASSTGTASRPSITGTGSALRTCNPPTNWTAGGTPVSFTFQWLRNGDEIGGASSNTYLPDAAVGGADANKVLQCMVTGTTGTGSAPGGGALVATSPNSVVGSVSNPPTMGTTALTTPDTALNGANELTAMVELPSDQSFVQSVEGAGWTCVTVPPSGGDPAKAECTNSGVLGTQAETSLTLGIGLGPDLSDSTGVKVSASAIGVALPATASSSFEVEPARTFGFIPGRFTARALDEEGEDYTQAGGHPPLANTNFSLTRDHALVPTGPPSKVRPTAPLRNASAEVPPGFVGNPLAVSELCPNTDAMLASPPTCPPGAVVGELAFTSNLGTTDGSTYKRLPLYAMVPEYGVPAQFAAVESLNGGVYAVTPRLRPEDGYAIAIDAEGIVENPLRILDVRVILCSYGSNTILVGGAEVFRSCKTKDEPGAYVKPFLTTQTECKSDGPVTRMSIDSWANPGAMVSDTSISPKMTGCELVPFEPKLDLQPTTGQAESASGLDVDLTVPTDGFEDPDGLTQAHLKKTTVTMPQGMSLNPSAADGLAACTQAQLGMVNGVPNNDPVQCPDASKIGTALVKTPILEETLEGGIYLAKQGDHPFPGDIAAIYVVAESKERGVLIKLPGRVEIRPGGQIVSTFDDNPQAPFSSLELSFDSGPRAALMTPQRCGTYNIVSELTPWSAADPDNPTPAETVSQTSSFDVTSGPGGGPCPNGALLPTMRAGLTSPLAGASSPFVFNLSRPDGTQRINGLALTLPQGLAANLRGVAYCPDVTLASIPSAQGTGAAEIANPSCPAASRLGSVSVAAGAGNPFWVNSGSAYLAGPYKGAPLSLAVVIPAVAGPFDLGNVVVRNAILVNPKTAQVSIKSDPLPTHVHNLPVDLRAVRVAVDRPGFMRAPTNCEEMRIDAVIDGEEGGSVPISNRFQVGECGSLGFKPHVKLQLKGGTKRNKFQRLTATVTAREGDANIAGASVRFPRSIFLEQNHIRTVCTRVQFAANSCPQASIYGFAEAETPLLDQPLRGPVYLRSSDNPLPDLVAALRGPDYQPITIELAGRTDSKNKGIRNTFDVVPDAPVSKFTLRMKGGKRSLLVTSTDICKRKQRADVRMRGQNGMQRNFRPVIKVNCKKKKQKQKKTRRGKASR